MNVLVTGGAGYIGSHAMVTVLDNLSIGHREAVHKSAQFIRGDVDDVALVKGLFAQHKTDAVLHFAAHIEVEAGVKKFVFSSTAAVYGTPERTPILETDTQ